MLFLLTPCGFFKIMCIVTWCTLEKYYSEVYNLERILIVLLVTKSGSVSFITLAYIDHYSHPMLNCEFYLNALALVCYFTNYGYKPCSLSAIV